jgi:acid phosphatase
LPGFLRTAQRKNVFDSSLYVAEIRLTGSYHLGNASEEMDYLNSLYSRWMPASSPRVAVDSHPRLSGIMDTINASLAHGPSTKLPPVFYDEKGREIVDKIAVDEWFAGYKENVEYRKLGIGALVGDIVDRMVSTAVEGGWHSETASRTPSRGKPIRFALSGCHDTTLAAILASMGAYENEKWPPFTSSIAIELFSTATNDRRRGTDTAGGILEEFSNPSDGSSSGKPSSFLSYLIGRPSSQSVSSPSTPSSEIARVPLSDLPGPTRKTLRQHYVRIRYNDRPMRIPGCAAKPSNHLPGDDTFCTLEAFKEIADKFTPRQWREECLDNINEGIFGKDEKDRVPSGY